MTSVERETGKGKGETELWNAAVAAIMLGFARAFDVEVTTSRTGVPEMRPTAAVS